MENKKYLVRNDHFPTVFPLQMSMGKSEVGKSRFPLVAQTVEKFSTVHPMQLRRGDFPMECTSIGRFPITIETVGNFPL